MGLEPMWGDQPRTQHKRATSPGTSYVVCGPGGVRTHGLLINSQLLNQPSSGTKYYFFKNVSKSTGAPLSNNQCNFL